MELKLKSKTIALAVTAALATTAFAQEAPPNPEPSDDATLDTMLVTGAQVPIEDSIMPTVRPYNAAFGVDQNILDVPRNVTIISREQLDAISVQDVRDFSKLTSSSYTRSNFGAPATPDIRGQSADLFVNGMRRGLSSNGNGMPVNFNAVDSVDIFKGPPTVIYGVSQYTGGFINLVTKRPYFDKFQGSASFTLGEYEQRRWTLDFGGPIIKDVLAYRISYSGEESGSYYENGNKNTEAIYGAITWTPSDKYTLELNAEMFFADYVENWGINRVTQDLIDNGKYITGFVGDVNGDGVINNKDVNSGFNAIIPGETITIDRSVRLLRPGDGSYGRSFTAQAVQTFNVADNLTIVNNTLYQWIKRQTKSSYYYSEIVDPAHSIENRTEFRWDLDIPFGGGASDEATTSNDSGLGKDGKAVAVEAPSEPYILKNQINFGIAERYQEVTAFNDFFNEPANAWDLSRPRELINYVNYDQGGSVPLDDYGYPGRFASPGVFNGDTNRSRMFSLSPFYQQQTKFTDALSLLFGARLDVLWIDSQDPLFNDAIGEKTPDFDGEDRTVVGIPNFNVSPTWKPFPWMTTYFTYNYSQSIGVANGGGFPTVEDSISIKNSIRNVSELFEVGAKFSLIDETLFLSSALFKQTRAIGQQGGGSFDLDVYGFEIETNYQPNKHFYATLGYTYLDAVYKNQEVFSVQQYTIDDPNAPFFVPGTILTDTFGAVGPSYGVADFEQPGLPDHLFNGLISYNFDTSVGNFGAILGAVVTSPYNADYLGVVTIPWQYSIDLTFVYKWKNIEARLAILNLSDEENWSPPNAVYALDSITPDLPRRIEGTIRVKF
ncbi:MAG TPA: TonB-dependent receptor plug domain-containing protein [Chthoniobacterales bacterium]